MSAESDKPKRVKKTWFSEQYKQLKRDHVRVESQYHLLLNAVTLVVLGSIKDEYIVGFLRQELIDAVPTSHKCLNEHKSNYFCRLPKGHGGDHQEGATVWPKEPVVKKRRRKKKKPITT